MEFKLIKSSDFTFEKNINIDTFSELIELCKNEGGKIIINTNEMEIGIYDDNRE